jgi:hypothetical protein
MQPRTDHVRVSARGVLWLLTWLGTRDGGPFEIPVLAVVELDAEGRQKRVDLYDPEKLEAAQARFSEIDAPAAESPFHNIASRGWRDGVIAAWSARDVPRFRALHEKLRWYRDHRRLLRLDLDRDGFLEFTVPQVETATRATIDLLATRGEQLALLRATQVMAGDEYGESAIDSLFLVESDEHGTPLAYDRYDQGDEEMAFAELDARAWPDDSTGAGRFNRIILPAVAAHDWDAGLEAFAPGLVGRDHRLAGWGTLHGPDAYMEAFRRMAELAPDARVRGLHERSSGRASLSSNVCLGTHDGGAFESPFLLVLEFGADRRALVADVYDPEQLDRAWARFEEIAAKGGRVPRVRP